MDNLHKVKWYMFLWDVFLCSLGSYGGPEAHYGVFSSILVKKKKYITEEELTEMIGLYALVPGPSSTQTITAIGYYVGGKLLAIFTFLVWALPAMIVMTLLGMFFTFIDANHAWEPVLMYLPAAAISFIVYAAITLSRKVLKVKTDIILYIIMLILGLLFANLSMWIVPLLLILGGLSYVVPKISEKRNDKLEYKPKWFILIIVVVLALVNEVLSQTFDISILNIYTSFYKYGYSVIGGGQIVVPLMITDLVNNQSIISLNDFLAGYAIDQAIPGPLFSFASFVSARSFDGSSLSFLAGIIGGFSIFLPGILLVFFIFPLWKASRKMPLMKRFLTGVSITAASLIVMTAINQSLKLEVDFKVYVVVVVSTLLLLTKKIPAPIIILLSMFLGFIV
ncbi:chromate efflux transporter [Acholeplasma laidlawii]|uniref:Chromate transport protein n=2 Tax=Acholeplasma laidlawii TaxID=2148 RepID=A9NGP5_ACHLI|nr:chromate efflux transporter [Acholeplasma laidlawii]ABX81525.1 chromate transport protein [Acholeplasma laidlawii PG-8A]NWH09902.1 chromate efflux transporter [Acholeplasma laidlawii]NWH11292.1 chromate efflux transporter [Acholeplasma laidlawii]NWH13298.1 chromate efflux transporter [Acholeplasma laidlawii]NWH14154.1 chromate efflux transporter [Acholeplasma laidlawii]